MTAIGKVFLGAQSINLSILLVQIVHYWGGCPLSLYSVHNDIWSTFNAKASAIIEFMLFYGIKRKYVGVGVF